MDLDGPRKKLPKCHFKMKIPSIVSSFYDSPNDGKFISWVYPNYLSFPSFRKDGFRWPKEKVTKVLFLDENS
jgi:hypothetical protein